ncbi:MAG: hypothetical protein KY437_03725 [Actinobacteria bacterium]|nr:hypothetical protein [Actinomycetota bacterium]
MSRRSVIIIVALVVLASAGTATAFWMDQRAERRAEVAAANREVRSEIADRERALRDTVAAGADAAATLRLTLEEHLTVSQRTDEELAASRVEAQQALQRAAQRLRETADRPAPELPPDADEDALASDLGQLREFAQRASELADRFDAVVDTAGRWAKALEDLRAQAQRYVDTVENQPETHDPDRLRRLWEEEKSVLNEYRAAADAAAEVDGLAPLAQAYLDYIDANLRFADEMIALLEEGDIDTYNQRLKETFETNDDPFEFQAAIEQGTDESLDRGVFEALRSVRSDATQLLADLDAEIADIAPSPAPSPAPSS